jgi:hypothetical protein
MLWVKTAVKIEKDPGLIFIVSNMHVGRIGLEKEGGWLPDEISEKEYHVI